MNPVKSKGFNGVIERAIQAVEGHIRTMKSQLDERYKVKIDIGHPIITWLCEYSTYLANRLEVGKDGKTSYERCRGKRAKVLGFEFGERVLWKKRQPGSSMQKMNEQWEYGLFDGIRRESGELLVASEKDRKIKSVRTARRVREQERWNEGHLDWVRVVPWNLGAEDREADGDIPEFDFRSGPGVKMNDEDIEKIKTAERKAIVHNAHLKRPTLTNMAIQIVAEVAQPYYEG